jgi:RNA polymerase-binding transcription factor DksA
MPANALKINGKVPPPKLGKLVKGKPLNLRELKKFKKILVELRERVARDILFLTTDNLHRAGRETGADLSGSAQHSADHGTDNFDREFALSLASTEQDVLYEVDEALMRIEEGEYGVCEMTGVQIERARLEVIPYTRYSVQAQSKMEQSRAKYRPFAQKFRGW